MTDAERAALERYRRQLPVDGYGRSDEVECTELFLPTQEYEDKCILANLALHEHPVDEGDEIDGPWIDQLCADVLRGKHAASWRGIHHDDGSTSFIMNAHRCDSAASCSGVPVKVRGDVYRLLRALGIEVKG